MKEFLNFGINKYILAFSLAYIRFYGCYVSKPVFYFFVTYIGSIEPSINVILLSILTYCEY